METIRLGSKGETVKVLQRYLSLIDDGVFGNLTDEVLRQWQKDYGLVDSKGNPDGICGIKTWSKIKEVYGENSEIKQGDAIPLSPNGTYMLKKTARKINDIILHCTATREGKDYSVETIKKWHTKPVSEGGRGWSDIAYHYVIYRDGSVMVGRPIDKIGGHTLNHNTGSIGIVYVGGCQPDSLKAKDTRTKEQKEALLRLVRQLMNMYGLGDRNKNLHGHYEYANKACPSFDMNEFRKEL